MGSVFRSWVMLHKLDVGLPLRRNPALFGQRVESILDHRHPIRPARQPHGRVRSTSHDAGSFARPHVLTQEPTTILKWRHYDIHNERNECKRLLKKIESFANDRTTSSQNRRLERPIFRLFFFDPIRSIVKAKDRIRPIPTWMSIWSRQECHGRRYGPL